MTTHQDIENLIPAYALNCLDEDEALLLAEHLAACPACRDEMLAYQRTVNQLALAAPPTEPSPQLQQRLARRIRPANAATSRQAARSWWQTVLAGFKQSAPVWGAVAVVLLIGLGLANVWPVTPASQPMRVVSLAPTQAAPTASGVMVVSSDGEYGAVIVENLPHLPSDQQYQLWLIDDGQRTSGAIFSVDEHGYRAVQVESPRYLIDYDGFGITIEPAGGSPGPTGPKVLGGEF